ncbi:MAG: hypothetical protein AAFV88_04345 [Planctomycetota bacterium]
MATSIKLTPREIALAKGEPLPAETATAVADEVVEDREEILGDEAYGSDDVEDDDPPILNENDYYPEDDTVSQSDGSEPDGESKWFENEETQQFAQSYGLSAKDLTEFESKEELERFGRMVDRNLASGTQPATSQIPGFQQHQQPEPRPQAKQEPAATESADQDDDVDQPFDIEKMKAENYDENFIRVAKAHNRQIEQRKQQEVESQQRAHHDALVSFHKALDSLDESQFGKVFDEGGGRVKQIGNVHQMNRDSVFQTMQRMYDSLAVQGQANIPIEHIARRAAGIVMGDMVSQKTEPDPKRTESVRRQSRKRRPTSSGARSGGSNAPAPQGGSDEVAEVANNPKLKQFWDKVQRQNGAV